MDARAPPGEAAVLWDLNAAVGVPKPWGIPAARVAQVQEHLDVA